MRENGQHHAVQFYQDDGFLHDQVAGFLADGLRARQPLLVIATAHRAQALATRLSSRGIELDDACRSGQLTMLDAHEALASFMVDDRPDARLFREWVGGAIERVSAEWPGGGGVRAYGEMMDVLWQDGRPEAALDLEELWNELSETHRFQLLCAYSLGNFSRESHAEAFRQVCATHTHVLPAADFSPLTDDPARLREIARLQQRALSLEAEVEKAMRLEQELRSALADGRRELEERLRTEAALRDAKEEAERANRVKSQFLAVMSHELRTPLNAIMGYEDLLRMEVAGPVTGEQRAFLGRIQTAARQLLRLVDQVLSMSRIEAGREELSVESVDLAALVRETCAFVQPGAAAKGLELRLELPAAPVPCATDPGKLRQVLLNLLSNAVKFTNAGGVELRVTADQASVVFEVRDTGAGIGAEDLERIFEPFVQVDYTATRAHGGVGLGLAVSRDLTRLLGGELTVASVAGAGSVFTVRLPRGIAADVALRM